MSTSNQQTLAESGASERPHVLEKGSYVPWENHFMRFLDNKQEEGELMQHSIEVGPYERKMIQLPDKPDDPTAKIIEPLSKMTESNKKQYFADIRVMNFIFQGIPNDIYNSVDACKNAQQMWERIRRLMHGSEKTKQQRHSRLVDEFDKFVTMEGESLSYVYERLKTLVNVIDRNEIHLLPITINTKVKKAAKNHDPLTLVAHTNVYPSHSYTSPLYSHSPQPYYVTHPSSVVDYKEDYQREIQGDAQEDKLIPAIMLFARSITQQYSTPTNNRLRTSSNTRNQAVIQDGRVDTQSKNVGYAGNGHYARDCLQPKVHDAKYFREQMLLAMKDEAGSNLNEKENNFMLDNHYGDDSLEELNAAVNASHIHLKSRMHSKSVHEHTNHAKLKTVINTSDDDQIDSSIIFDDPCMDNNGGTDDHDSNADNA
ncbi:hypothetical protein Tco_0733657 [Tanacetum coccineum]